jgi:hypothetical protein
MIQFPHTQPCKAFVKQPDFQAGGCQYGCQNRGERVIKTKKPLYPLARPLSSEG